MPVSIGQTIIFLLFLSSWLLLLLLGESYVSYLLLGGISLLMLLLSGFLDWKKFKEHQYLAGLWLFFLISLIVSVIFSSILPLSIYVFAK